MSNVFKKALERPIATAIVLAITLSGIAKIINAAKDEKTEKGE